MKTARLLSTVAAAVLLTAGVVSAQVIKQDQPGASPAPNAQQKAPAEKIAPPMHSNPGMKADEGKSVQNKTDLKQKHETTGQAPKSSDMDKSPSTGKTPSDSNGGNAEIKSKNENGAAVKGDTTKSTQSEKPGAATKSTESEKAGSSPTKSTDSNKADSRATSGQGVANAAKLSTEQRSRITTIIKQQKVEPAKLSVTARVGTRVPDSVHFYPLPVEVVVVYPEWRGYDYIMVGNEILVIDPRTHEIVAILDA